ncbi:MAG: hypothetical protein J6L75_03080, partial [Alistipes sp.]|nr:hypothetical protein [Alistipes sp.]
MKKLLMAVAAFGMLLTSCAKDDTVAPVEDKEALVSFCVNSPAVATRYGEGETAQDLYYAVYDTQEGFVAGLSATDSPVTINISTTVNLNLVQGRSYEIIFWAQNTNAPYTLTWGNTAAEAKMTYDPQATLTANNEEYDAFYKYVEPITVNGAISQTVELKRPFAQLNVATADLEKARVAGVDIKKTGVKVKGVYNCLNLKSGAVPQKNAAVELTFDMADMATGTITANGKTYSHIAMNYVLVNEKELVDVTLTLAEDATEGTADLTRNYTSVPVQRNYRTNIIGNILTSTADFNVEIKPGFTEPAYEGFFLDENGTSAIVATTVGLKELAEKINNGEISNDINISLNDDIDLSLTTSRSASSNWTPIGTPEVPYIGTFNGGGYTIKNLNIVETEAKEGKAYIGFFGYAKNATIKNVTFEN